MRVIILPPAQRDFRKLDRDIAVRMRQAILQLADDPRPHGALVLREWAFRAWRIRVGDWRVIYTINDTEAVVTIVRILHRSKAY